MSSEMGKIIESCGGRADLLEPLVKERLGDGLATPEAVREAVLSLKADPKYWPGFRDRRGVESYEDLGDEASKIQFIESEGLDAFLKLLRAHYSRSP